MPDRDDDLMVGDELVLSGFVGDDWMGAGFTYAKLVQALNGLDGRDVTVRLNSGGGFATEGAAIHAALSAYDGEVTVRIEGIAASAASLIAMAADRIEMAPGALMMIHDPSALTIGPAEAHRTAAQTLDRMADTYAAVYAARSGQDVERVRELMVAETWMDGAEAVALGFADAALTAERTAPAEASAFDFTIYAAAPERLCTLSQEKGWRFRRPEERAVAREEVVMTTKTQAASKPAKTAAAPETAAETMTAPEAVVAEAAPAPAPTMAVDPAAITLAERTRVKRIHEMTALMNVPELAAAMIDDGASVEQAVERVMEIKATMSDSHGLGRGRPTALIVRDERETKRAGMEAALLANMRRRAPDTDAARPFMGMTLVEMAADAAGWRGDLRTAGDRAAAFEMAMHSTSDFPAIFENVLNKTLLESYQTALPTYRAIAREVTFNDFRPHPMLRIGDFPALQDIGESGEIKFGTVGESKETAILKAYAVGVSVTRQMIVNDELGAIDQVLAAYGTRVAHHEEQTFYAFLDSAVLADTTAVWHASRNNLAGTGTAITVAAVGAGRAGIRKQSSIDGMKLNLNPSILLVSPDKETEADQLVAGITPSKRDDVNPFTGRLTVVTSAQLSGNAWYLFASPASPGGACFAYGYLSGQEAPRVRIEEPFGRQGTSVTVEHDFGVGAIDFRGTWKNPGA